MKLTNKHNLPGPVYRAIQKELRPNPPRYGATTLLRPPRMVALEIKHWHEIEVDAMDLAYRLYGTAIHKMFEIDDPSVILSERMLEMPEAGVTVRCAIDLLWRDGPRNVLTDYKSTRIWSVIYGKPDWELQLNIYNAILDLNGYRADRLEALVFLKDWGEREARFDSQKPQTPIVTVGVSLWLPERGRDLARSLVAAHKATREEFMRGGSLRECSPEERWAKPDTWAVMKAGRKSALRVLPSNAEAEQWGQNNAGGKFTIEFRPGENTRCERYCPVSKFCDQFKQLKEAA